MKPKNMVAIKTEPEFIKASNVKMAINKAQKRFVPSLEGMTRSTVLVNNSSVPQRGVIANTRVVTQRTNQDIRCKRKINFVPGQNYPGTQPASVARRNARERNRVKQVNNGFATLRSHIPPSVAAALTTEKSTSRNSSNKKLSKVETLKMAVEYIRSLQQMLEDSTGEPYHNENYEEEYYSSSPEGSHLHSQQDLIVQHEYYPRYTKTEPEEYYIKKYPKSEPEDYELELYSDSPQGSPKLDSPKQFRQYDKNPNGTITILSGANSYSSHAFVQPRQRHSTSLSPPISEACPSPTPSYASDNSSIHTSSIVSSSSGQVTSAFSRLTTSYVPETFPSPVAKPQSPIRHPSPNSVVSSTVASSSSPSYNNQDFQKHSPEYDNYEPMSPEDEELLDVISWWQQSH